jgi:fructosamine-3-kinase
MFEAEEQGLREMAATGTIRVPAPVCSGAAGGQAYLVLEYLELGGSRGDGPAKAGRQLAEMHRHTRDRFGWDRDNTIGSTPQHNGSDTDWVRFWRDQRLGFQLELAGRNGHGGELQRRGEALLERFGALIDHDPMPSLIHGDLWGGNIAYAADGDPVVFDPAVYYADREADLAMTELFGSFGGRFYAAYEEAWPLDPGYGVRKTLYNLYHVLNHLNLFGAGYLGQARRMIDRLLAEVG